MCSTRVDGVVSLGGPSNVFSTGAGVHQDGLLKHPDTYVPFRPDVVGAPPIRLKLGKHSGRAAFIQVLSAMGYAFTKPEIDTVIELAKAAPKDAWNDERLLLATAVATMRTSN